MKMQSKKKLLPDEIGSSWDHVNKSMEVVCYRTQSPRDLGGTAVLVINAKAY